MGNPFEDYNPIFTYYKSSEPIVTSVEDPLFGKLDIEEGFRINPQTGNYIALANTPKNEEFLTNYLNRMAKTHSESSIKTHSESPTKTSSNKIVETSSINLNIKGNLKKAMEFFLSKGLNAHLAAGIVGNLIIESGGLQTNIKGDGGKAYGLALWHPDRLKGLKALALSRGKDISDFDTLLEYVWLELNTGYKLALNKILNSKNVKEATTAFMTHYEKPGIPHFDKRLKAAEELLS